MMSRKKSILRFTGAFFVAPLGYIVLGVFYDFIVVLFSIRELFGSIVDRWVYWITGAVYMQFAYFWNFILVIPSSIFLLRYKRTELAWSLALSIIVALLAFWTANALTPDGKHFAFELFDFFWPFAPATLFAGWVFWRIAIRPHRQISK